MVFTMWPQRVVAWPSGSCHDTQSQTVWRLQSLWLQLPGLYGRSVWGYFLTVMILLSDTIHNVKLWAIIPAGDTPQRGPISSLLSLRYIKYWNGSVWQLEPSRVELCSGGGMRLRKCLADCGLISVIPTQWPPSSNDIPRENYAFNQHPLVQRWRNSEKYNSSSGPVSVSLKMIINGLPIHNPWISKQIQSLTQPGLVITFRIGIKQRKPTD